MARLGLVVALLGRPFASGILLSSYASFLVDSVPPSRTARFSQSAAEALAAPPPVEIFSTLGCGFCSRAKRRLTQLAVAYAEVDVSGSSGEMRTRMAERAGGRTAVPQIFIGGEHLGGFDELVAAEASGALWQMLEPLGIKPLLRSADDHEQVTDLTPAARDMRYLMPQGGILNHLQMEDLAPGHLPGPLLPAAGPAAPSPTGAQLSASLQRQILSLYDEFVTPDGYATPAYLLFLPLTPPSAPSSLPRQDPCHIAHTAFSSI
jgi:glutaredoxin 3